MKHLGTVTLESDKLNLRQFKQDDAEAMYKNWANDSEVTKYLTWPTHDSIEVSKLVLKDWVNNYKNINNYQWAIVLKDNGDEPIGSIGGVKANDDINMVHIGYCIGKKWWNKGITSEALNIIIKYLIEEVGINRIESRHDPRNEYSGKVMEKCGLFYEGTLRKADRNNQGICDASYYGILAEDYFQKNAQS